MDPSKAGKGHNGTDRGTVNELDGVTVRLTK